MNLHRMRLFCFLLLVLVSILLAGCNDDDTDSSDDDDDAGDDDDDDNDDDDTAPWEPVEPHTETHEGFTLVWLTGNHYEMGRQQGELLHNELKAGVDWLNEYHLIDIILPIARATGVLDLAYENSYPEFLDECKGLGETAGDVGFTEELCMLLNFGDALIALIGDLIPFAKGYGPGCTQAVATGDATADGKLIHARSMDWDEISFLLDYPVIFIRQPDKGIPHVFIGFPGNMSPYQGLNAEGIFIASDMASAANSAQVDRQGRSGVQAQARMLETVASLSDAKAFMEAQDWMCPVISTISDGNASDAMVFELTAEVFGEREMQAGTVWATNHFVHPDTYDGHEAPGDSSLRRFERVEQLIAADGEYTDWGSIDVETMVALLRDRVDPWTMQESPEGTFDNDKSIATNGAIYQVVFDPENLFFWVAAGQVPVSSQPFVGFSLTDLLDYPDAVPVDPPAFEME